MSAWTAGLLRKLLRTMTSTDVTVVVGIVSVVSSWFGAGFIVAFRSGSFTYRMTALENRFTAFESRMDTMATKDQLAGVKEDIAEIKGMFRMTLRQDVSDAH